MEAALRSLESIKREQIIGRGGVSFKDFRRTLKPHYAIVWRDLLAGHIALAIIAIAMAYVETAALGWKLLVGAVGTILFGYVHAYIQLFFHEASHYNIAKNRKWNEMLANIFIGALVGQDIRKYRPIHMMHHRYLGTPQDSERSYFDALTLKFIIESLTGIRVLKVLMNRKKIMEEKPAAGEKESYFNYQALIGAALNGAIIAGAAWFGYWVLAASWLLGLAIVFPFFGAVRQVLEHRDENAHISTDFTKVPHGEVNRMFGTGIVASTLGGAGFNRHLLHHWEPQISYTNLREVEEFLAESNVADIVRSHNATYLRVFWRLLHAPM